jgi:hypothetical protein
MGTELIWLKGPHRLRVTHNSREVLLSLHLPDRKPHWTRIPFLRTHISPEVQKVKIQTDDENKGISLVSVHCDRLSSNDPACNAFRRDELATLPQLGTRPWVVHFCLARTRSHNLRCPRCCFSWEVTNGQECQLAIRPFLRRYPKTVARNINDRTPDDPFGRSRHTIT